MDQISQDQMPVIVIGLLLILLSILRETAPSIIKWIQSKVNVSTARLEQEAAALHNPEDTEIKKFDVATEAQAFLSDIGKTFYKQLAEDRDSMSSRLSENEDVINNLRDQLQRLFLEREEMRIKLAANQEDQSILKQSFAAKNVELDLAKEKVRQVEDQTREIMLRLEKMQVQLDNNKAEIERLQRELESERSEKELLSKQLEEANRRLDEAYSRFDHERDRANRLEMELTNIRKSNYYDRDSHSNDKITTVTMTQTRPIVIDDVLIQEDEEEMVFNEVSIDAKNGLNLVPKIVDTENKSDIDASIEDNANYLNNAND